MTQSPIPRPGEVKFAPVMPVDGSAVADEPMPTGAELDIIARRELAHVATAAIRDVLEVDVSIAHLQILADDPESTEIRLVARRALRCIAGVAGDDSKVIKKIGEDGIYHYAEAVIDYGASEGLFLELIDGLGLPAERVTGLYALRDEIAKYTNGRPGFAKMIDALRSVGLSPEEASIDPEASACALDEAGFFVGYTETATEFSGTYSQPIFKASVGEDRLVVDDTDGSITDAIRAGFRAQASVFPEETED